MRRGGDTDDPGTCADQLSAADAATRRRRRTFPDLRAVVHLDEAPDELLAELPELYGSAYSIGEYFAICHRPRPWYACELDDPRHVLVFSSHGATAEAFNERIRIEPAAVDRLAAAIFRARPEIRRIRAMWWDFPPRELPLPLRELHRNDDQVVELPASEEAYERSLGASTRRHVRQYRYQLGRKYPGFSLRTLEGEEITLALVEQVFDWNRQRILAKGKRWSSEAPYGVWRLLQSHGVALCGYVGDECVAGWLLMVVGRDSWALRAGFDPIYGDVHLGFLMNFHANSESIRRGCVRAHWLWGSSYYKHLLGAAPVTSYRVSIYRSRLDKALYARERWSYLVRYRKRIYWRARGALKRRVLAALRGFRGEPKQAPPASRKGDIPPNRTTARADGSNGSEKVHRL